MTSVWPLIITGHVNYSDSRTSISEINSVTCYNLSDAVQPEQLDRLAELLLWC